jgi:hypothetical protein
MALTFKGATQSGITPPDYGSAISNIAAKLQERRLKSLDTELTDYFTGSNLYSGGLSIAGGELSYNTTSTLPSFNEAWASYKGIYSKHGESAGMAEYTNFRNIYSDMTKTYGSQLIADIKKYSNAGYSESDIRKALTANADYMANLNTLIGDPVNGASYGEALANFAPKKSFWGIMDDSPGTVGMGIAAAGVAGVGGYKALSAIPVDVMDDARGGYKESLAKARSKYDLNFNSKTNTWSHTGAQKLLEDAKATIKKRKLKPDGKVAKQILASSQTAADKLKQEALDKFKKSRSSAGTSFRGAAKTRGAGYAKYLQGTSNLAKGVGYMALPSMVEGGVATMTDSEEMGDIAGSATAATMTTAQAMSSGAQLGPALKVIQQKFKKHGAAKVLRQVMKVGGMGLATRTLAKAGAGTIGGAFTGGAMTALMAAWSIKDLYDISQIIADM